MQIMGSLS